MCKFLSKIEINFVFDVYKCYNTKFYKYIKKFIPSSLVYLKNLIGMLQIGG